MSGKRRKRKEAKRQARAIVFAALGDETRLLLVSRLGAGEPASIAQLTEGSSLTRQAVTKHLRVLQSAGVVHCRRQGRESLFTLDPEPLNALHDYLDRVSRRWDESLARLKAFVED
ncbi:MAG TPA: metalloregulator ArsR/SmtB family transcription factor [Terracidiphilus sp.]|nr:metalloregulator ArsR/SmtB family transcription factor [Terracidiphilus sp.]